VLHWQLGRQNCHWEGPQHRQLLPSGPGFAREAIRETLMTAIFGAEDELVLTTPYFVPDEPVLEALISAAKRGVAVTLGLGILTSVFTAIFVTRLLIVIWFARRRPKTIEV